MINVFLLLGSNLGDRQLFLKQAIAGIENMAEIVKLSSVYETEAWGKEGEPDYLNQVVLVKTDLLPRAMLKKLLDLEKSLGRKRNEKWGSRTIDIDILFFGEMVINDAPGLMVPHPRLHERRFTLEPLGELDPQFVHPVLKKSILQLKNELTDSLIVKKL
ncbi:2-amino-4-hydroxy-6-hydroxymethyldihydropteridine diphosphokinase [Mucilaginibacter polytrichastri]|uniref:2-amino-4-hydroxy-6-hydroxymethyldihydropteridine pyrophosphokinase n=1 Tax=Mucilaginibacter polytrichastri TaxID=1302689 RepID=A0A1Q5ZUT1_9SPHI|nr:2-amino-4-hydroxy-6-hydroxymethyldihydropteridine diphosphokinase [Mucilaginibacter polytrichastri]OKS85483.1 2-amino-4-hydroxy-6-hydroxymethyldihydropteridine pyrophosphokinase [Mucilaginibacter polytrichastri]SFS38043.1 2-amino-4-hydroxy-6-hydroxymethyldihydropteridinediphosphokinase [Mucilaginibacter polytrichastri]